MTANRHSRRMRRFGCGPDRISRVIGIPEGVHHQWVLASKPESCSMKMGEFLPPAASSVCY